MWTRSKSLEMLSKKPLLTPPMQFWGSKGRGSLILSLVFSTRNQQKEAIIYIKLCFILYSTSRLRNLDQHSFKRASWLFRGLSLGLLIRGDSSYGQTLPRRSYFPSLLPKYSSHIFLGWLRVWKRAQKNCTQQPDKTKTTISERVYLHSLTPWKPLAPQERTRY